LTYHHRKTGALIAQQVQQLLISAVERHPAHLRLHAVPQQLQLFSDHLFTRASLIIGPLMVPTAASTSILLLINRQSAHGTSDSLYRKLPVYKALMRYRLTASCPASSYRVPTMGARANYP
jgi:hypothetical protein